MNAITVTVMADNSAADELRQLYAWLLAEDDLRGGVELVERGPDQDGLGPVLEALRILADPGGAVLASAVVAWLKQRRSSVNATITGVDGKSVSLKAERIRLLDDVGVAELTERVARVVSDQPAVPSSSADTTD